MKRNETHTFYNFQFKHTAVTITNHPNIQSINVAEALKIHPIMLYRWRQEMREGKLENNDQEALARQVAAGQESDQEVRARIEASPGRECGTEKGRADLSRKK